MNQKTLQSHAKSRGSNLHIYFKKTCENAQFIPGHACSRRHPVSKGCHSTDAVCVIYHSNDKMGMYAQAKQGPG